MKPKTIKKLHEVRRKIATAIIFAFFFGICTQSFGRFARQMHPVTIRLQRISELFFGIAVCGRHIKIIHTTVDRPCDVAIRRKLSITHRDNTAVCNR